MHVEQLVAERVCDRVDRSRRHAPRRRWGWPAGESSAVRVRGREHPATGIEDPLSVDVQAWRRSRQHRDGSAPTPCRRCPRSPRTPRAPSRGSSRPPARCPVSWARSLVPTPSSARFSPGFAVRPEEFDELRAEPALRRRPAGRRAPSAWPVHRSAQAARGSRRPAARRRPVGAMKPSPQGRLPNAPRVVRSPSSAMPGRPLSSSVRSVPRGQETCAAVGVLQQRRDRARACGHQLEVGRHHAREHVLGDARHRRAARTGVARALARRGVTERARGRRDVDITRGQRGGQRRRRLGAVGRPAHPSPRAPHPPPAALAASRSASPIGRRRRIDDHEHIFTLADGQATADHGVDGRTKIGHAVIICSLPTSRMRRPRDARLRPSPE